VVFPYREIPYRACRRYGLSSLPEQAQLHPHRATIDGVVADKITVEIARTQSQRLIESLEVTRVDLEGARAYLLGIAF
jgi:hypothetical protein